MDAVVFDLVDTHSHLDVPDFDHDRPQVIARARAAGVQRQVVPAIAADTWHNLRAVCAAHSGLFPAYGLHPMCVDTHRPAHVELLRAWLESERSVAVGECGLDFYIEGLDPEVQARYFNAQLQLAREFDLPVIVHARRAVDAVIAALRRHAPLRGVVHSFPGSEEQARQLWKLGFLLGIGGPVTYPRAARLRRLAASMPLEFLLLETDSPDQPNADTRGERNEPARMRTVLDAIAELREIDPSQLARATTANAERLFALPARAPTEAPSASAA